MEPIAYLQILRRRWAIVLAATLIGVVAGMLTAEDDNARPAEFEATHTLSVLRPALDETSDTETLGLTLSASQLAVFAEVGNVPVGAVERLDYDGSARDLVGQIEVEADDALGTIRITAVDTSPRQSQQIANAVALELKHLVNDGDTGSREERLDAARFEVQDLQERIATLDSQLAVNPPDAGVITAQRDALINQYRIAYDELQALNTPAQDEDVLVTLEAASPGPVPTGGLQIPQKGLARMIFLGLVGAALGAALALVLDRLDQGIRTKKDAEAATRLPVLAEIPTLPRRYRGEIVSASRPASPFAEAYRTLRTTLAFALAHRDGGDDGDDEPGTADLDSAEPHPPQVILVTSAGPFEGKSTSVANLAASYAETDQSVLVLDCDFRRPRLHHIFGTPERPGLSDSLKDPSAFAADREVLAETDIPNVLLAPAGTPTDNPAQLFVRARRMVEASRRQADVILIDTPPYLVASDAAEIAPYVDAVLVVIRARRTTIDAAERLAELLERHKAPVAGVVLVGTDAATVGYGTTYYYRANARTDRARRAGSGWFHERFGRRHRSRPADADSTRDDDQPADPGDVEPGPDTAVVDGAHRNGDGGDDGKPDHDDELEADAPSARP